MKKTIVSSIITLNFLTATCYGQANKNHTSIIDNLSAADTSFTANDKYSFYFPIKEFTDNSPMKGLDSFLDAWYSQQLFAMREPVLFNDESQNETYRFTWLRSFDNPVAIRIERKGDIYTIIWKESDGKGGYEPGKLKINKQKRIDKATWDEFIRRLNLVDFWNLKTMEEILGNDGAEWILEGKIRAKYHVVNRWTPEKRERNYYLCCNYLIELTDLEIKSDAKY